MASALSLSDARARILRTVVAPLPSERVTLDRAHGRTLAGSIRADTPWPATDRSAMDGFALAAGSGLAVGASLRVVGDSLAGKPFVGALGDGEAIRIMTGAVVPAGADAVVPVEQTSGFHGERVELRAAVRAGQHIRPFGSELVAGTEVLAAGTVLRAAAIGVLAVLGHTVVEVRRRPVVAIVATGDEVVPADSVPLPHQVRESNSWAAAAQVGECGGEPLRLGVAPDETEALRALLQRALREADVVLTIGGISKGTHDLVQQVLGDLGVRTQFHGLDLKPGKPTFFGLPPDGGRARAVLGLPGNPASSFTVFDLLVRPLLVALLGGDPGEWRAQLPWSGAPWHANSRLQAVPALLQFGPDGVRAVLVKPTPSGDPFGLLGGSGYVLVGGQRAPGETPLVPFVGGAAGVWLP
ncbi:MAG: molybdopterin molybdotransferase MoeA [Planctomycetes bacterium]|nr:molybdopterin molybdotransferase MoeA [Planctomycetota bacterium]